MLFFDLRNIILTLFFEHGPCNSYIKSTCTQIQYKNSIVHIRIGNYNIIKS